VTVATGYGSGYRRALGIPENAELAGDPVRWVHEVLGEYCWSKQREILMSVQSNRYTAVQSCHDTGKSFTASRTGTQWIDTRPDPFLVTTAPTWKQVNAILWREMRKAFRKGGLKGRINLDAEWYMNQDELVAFGRKPADYDQAAFQGIHALNVLVVIDEACGVPQSIFEAADSLVTNIRGRVLAIGNPDDPSSYFAEICKPGSGWNVIQIGAWDTPAFTGEEVPDTLLDLLISPEWVEERKKRWGEGSPIYQSKVMGQFPDITDDTVFTPKMIREAQERELPSEMHGQLGVDVARFGDGETAIYRARGGRVRLVKVLHKADTMQTADTVAAMLRPLKGRVRASIDIIGVGGGVYDRLKQLKMPIYPFNSSERADDTERFHNRRAEAYFYARELADREQLGSVKWKLTAGGKIVIESKEEMKKRGMPSPDRADAAIMALYDRSQVFEFDWGDDEVVTTPTSGLRHRAM
jgi:hypothetical protein